MTSINVYLTFNGNCEEAFTFYRSVFGGEFSHVGRFNEMPSEQPLPSVEGEKIMHIALPISEETRLMGSDTGGEWAAKLVTGNNFFISITTDRKEEADRLFQGLSVEGQVTMAMENTFWGDYFGMFTDKFGINWMISCNPGQPSA